MTLFLWPEDCQTVAFLSVHFDADSFDLRMADGSQLFGRFSYGRYGIRAGFSRLMNMLSRLDIKATFFVPAEDAKRNPSLIRSIVSEGHELAARGIFPEDISSTFRDEEREILQTARDTLADLSGIVPVGFRAFNGLISPNTLRILTELEFLYDSSFQDGDYPYVFELPNERKIIEIPTSEALQDAPLYSARHTHRRLYDTWRDECTANYEVGVLIPLTLHLRGDIGSTRVVRLQVVEKILHELLNQQKIIFMTGKELAEYTSTLDLIPEQDPYISHANTLKITPYRGDLSVKPI